MKYGPKKEFLDRSFCIERKQQKVGSSNSFTLVKKQESHYSEMILKTPFIRRKLSKCQNPMKQPPPNII